MIEFRRNLGILAATLLAAGSLLAVPAWANGDHDRAKLLMEAGKIVPLESIILTAKAEHPGSILEVDLEEIDGRLYYEIDVLEENGEVIELYFDAKSGKLTPGVHEEEHQDKGD